MSVNLGTVPCPKRDAKAIEHNHHIVPMGRKSERHCMFCGNTEKFLRTREEEKVNAGRN